MPIIKSAKKRVNVARKAAIRNSKTKKNFKKAIKAFNEKPTAQTYSSAQSKIDIATKKGLIHKNKAARLKKKAAAKAKSQKASIVNTPKKAVVNKTPSKATTKKVTSTKPKSTKKS